MCFSSLWCLYLSHWKIYTAESNSIKWTPIEFGLLPGTDSCGPAAHGNPLFSTMCHLSSLNKILEVAFQQKKSPHCWENPATLAAVNVAQRLRSDEDLAAVWAWGSTVGNEHALNYSVGVDFCIHLIPWHFEHVGDVLWTALPGFCHRRVAIHFAFWGTVDVQADEMHRVFAGMGELGLALDKLSRLRYQLEANPAGSGHNDTSGWDGEASACGWILQECADSRFPVSVGHVQQCTLTTKSNLDAHKDMLWPLHWPSQCHSFALMS